MADARMVAPKVGRLSVVVKLTLAILAMMQHYLGLIHAMALGRISRCWRNIFPKRTAAKLAR